MTKSGVYGRFKVDFLIAGTQKGGTTALDAYLREHPQICMATSKEVHFFDNESVFRSGRKLRYARYHMHFRPSGENQVVGEATPAYMFWPTAPARIKEYNPDMKLVLVLRNPISRAFSHWNMLHSKGKERLSFWDAIMAEQERCRDPVSNRSRAFSYLGRGFYSQQLERIWLHFPKSQTLVLRHEDLKSNPRGVLDMVCELLCLPPLPAIREKDVHSTPYSSPMTPFEWQYLRNLYEPDVRRLEGMLKWDCSEWLVRPEAGTGAATVETANGGRTIVEI